MLRRVENRKYTQSLKTLEAGEARSSMVHLRLHCQLLTVFRNKLLSKGALDTLRCQYPSEFETVQDMALSNARILPRIRASVDPSPLAMC